MIKGLASSSSALCRLGSLAARARRELDLYRRVAVHPRTPRLSRWLLALAVAYAASPIDFIPDFIPVLGHLDDAVIIPALMIVALKRIPDGLIDECREASAPEGIALEALPQRTDR